MLNKKIVLLSIFLVSLLAVSAVSATENMSDDIISHEDVSFDIKGMVKDKINKHSIITYYI